MLMIRFLTMFDILGGFKSSPDADVPSENEA